MSGTASLTVVCWLWDQPGYPVRYLPEHVTRLAGLLRTHIKQPHRIICLAQEPDTVPTTHEVEPRQLWRDYASRAALHGAHRASCYRRLKLFDPTTQLVLDIAPGQRIVSMDLDVDVVGALDPLFDRPERFVGWSVPGHNHPRVLNGTLFMLRAGELPWVWSEFDINRSPREADNAGFLGSDQAWMSHRLLATEATWSAADGVLSFTGDCGGSRYPRPGARIISYAGYRLKPWDIDNGWS